MSPVTEDVIRELCAVAATAEGKDFETAIAELSNALREHAEKAENLGMSILLKMPPPKP